MELRNWGDMIVNDPVKVMLVDDEDSIRKVVEEIIKKDKYQFCYAADGEQALELFQSAQPDLIILDVMLPGIDGFELCKTIRLTSSVPIIMLSAKGDIVDKSVGFNMGADDYLSKPFSPVELSLRIKALLRRVRPEVTTEGKSLKHDSKHDNKIVIQNIEIDCKSYAVRVDGKEVDLTPKEFELLCLLASHPGRVFTREQMFDSLWGEDYIGDTGTITVFIRKIREKIENNPARPEHIITVWGVGYKFCG